MCVIQAPLDYDSIWCMPFADRLHAANILPSRECKHPSCKGKMATVIGIFENCFRTNKALTIVKPGSQSRRFTHIYDTVETCYLAWKKNKCRHYSISNRESYTILEVAKMFNTKVRLLAPRRGERFASALTNMNLSNKVHKMFGKISLKDYIKNIIKAS